MTDHLSTLMLDELSAGAASPEVQAHARACAECATQKARVDEAEEATRKSAGYLQARARVRAEAALGRRTWVRSLLAALAASLGLVIWDRIPAGNHARLKGAAHLRLLDPSGTPVPGPVAPGSRVSISVGAEGHPYALLMAVDETGAVEQLWPVLGAESGRVPAGADVRLDPPFEVTPGSSALWAFFSDAPLQEDEAATTLHVAIEQARQQGSSPISVEPPPIPQESARAHTQLLVR